MSAVLYSLRDGKLRCNGREIRLSRIQWRILTALLAERGGWVSRSDLIYRTWLEFDESEPEYADKALCTHLRALRRKLVGTSIAVETGYGLGLRARINGRPEPEWGNHPYSIVAEMVDGRRAVWTPKSGLRRGPYGKGTEENGQIAMAELRA